MLLQEEYSGLYHENDTKYRLKNLTVYFIPSTNNFERERIQLNS